VSQHQKVKTKLDLLEQEIVSGSGISWAIYKSAPLSFNCYSEQVMRESVDELTWIGVTISGRTINNLRYADDIVLLPTGSQVADSDTAISDG